MGNVSPIFIVFSVLAYCFCSVCMLLVNKVVIQYINAPFFVLFVQNALSLVSIQTVKVLNLLDVDDIEWSKARKWIFVVVTFLVMLISSLKALSSVTVSTLIVFRNLNTLLVAFGEYRCYVYTFI